MTALEVMKLQLGDHVCSVYETEEQLVTTVARFLADGLARGERCWYVPSGPEIHAARSAIEQRGIDVDAQTRRTALHLLDSNDTYTVRGGFDPPSVSATISECFHRFLDSRSNWVPPRMRRIGPS